MTEREVPPSEMNVPCSAGTGTTAATTSEVWVIAEAGDGGIHESSLEALGEAERLARGIGGTCCAALLGERVSHLIGQLAQYGAGRVYLVEHPLLASYSTDAFAAATGAAINKYRPRLVLLAATPYGRELAPRLAFSLSAPLVTECTKIDLNEKGEMVATRPAYGDAVYTLVRSTAPPPYLASVRPGFLGLGQPNRSRQAELVTVAVDLDSASVRTRVLERIPPDPRTVDVSDAAVVISGGRGVGAENWKLLEEIAAKLGAAVSGSRVAMDAGWVCRDRVVGQTGKSVSAKLYLAVGISGASRHVAGIKNAKTIVAINNDRNASIFGLADLGLVGDAREVLEAINKVVQESGIGAEEVSGLEHWSAVRNGRQKVMIPLGCEPGRG